MAINTINFIDNQLNIIGDSLKFIENKIESFRLNNPNLEIVDKDFGTYFQKQKIDNSLSEQSVHIKYYRSLLSYLITWKYSVPPSLMWTSIPSNKWFGDVCILNP